MSQEINNDLEIEAYFKNEKGKWHRDLFGTWYMKQSGWESLFLNQIRDEHFKHFVENKIQEFANEKSKNFEYIEGMSITIFPETKTVSRKSEVDINQEELFDTNVPVEERVSKYKSQSSSNSSNTNNGEKRKQPIYINEDYIFFSEYKELKKKNWKLCLNPKASPNTFVFMNPETKKDEPKVMIAEMSWDY